MFNQNLFSESWKSIDNASDRVCFLVIFSNLSTIKPIYLFIYLKIKECRRNRDSNLTIIRLKVDR